MDELAIGKVIRMPCMRRGLCAYDDETILVTQEALEQLAKTSYGIPVTVEHPDEQITDANVNGLSVGRVSKIEYDASQDLWFAEFVVTSDDAIKLLQNGYGVSTAWYGDKYDKEGTYNNVPYNRELVEGRYEHLAIVKSPRYEMAVGPKFLNSKSLQAEPKTLKIETQNQKGGTMLTKVFKKLITREELKTNDNESLMVELDGEEKPLENMMDEYKEMKQKQNAPDEKPMVCGTDEVDVDGKKVTVNELIEAYKASMAKADEDKKEAAADDKDEKKEAAADEEKKEASDDEDKKEDGLEIEIEDEDEEMEEAAQKNSRFNSLKQAHENGMETAIEEMFMSSREKVLVGKTRYGTK
jgi:hypothetical protein